MFGSYLLETHSFLKGGGVNMRERRGKGLEEKERGETVAGMYCMREDSNFNKNLEKKENNYHQSKLQHSK